jgi:hypothetical protein
LRTANSGPVSLDRTARIVWLRNSGVSITVRR